MKHLILCAFLVGCSSESFSLISQASDAATTPNDASTEPVDQATPPADAAETSAHDAGSDASDANDGSHYMKLCTDNAQCESGDLCYYSLTKDDGFDPFLRTCSHTCKSNEDCPAPSTGCAPRSKICASQ